MQLGLAMSVANSRCLSHPGALTSWIRLTRDELLAEIERGTVPFAFDLRSPDSDRATLRLWHPTIEALVKTRGADSGPTPEIHELLLQLVPGRFDVRSSQLERDWDISHQHVHELIAAGCLPVSRQATAAAGPHSFSLLDPAGLRAFLASRLFGQSFILPTPAVEQACSLPNQSALR